MYKHLAVILFLLLPIFLRAQNDEVVFSHKGGVYSTAFKVSLSCQDQRHHIRYTLNGAPPDANARLYTNALNLDRTMVSSSDIYKIQISPAEEAFFPDTVMKAIVIRAAVFDATEKLVSKVVTQSYFIRSLGCEIHNLPVVSICADSLSLFSYDTGIMVPGVCCNPDSSDMTGNYVQHGREWERCVNVEFYTKENDGFNQTAGLRTHGGVRARRAQQKGLKLYAREEYGKKNFKCKIFEEIALNKYKHLVLKPFRNAITPAGIQDWLANHIASQMNMGTLASRPVALFLNGEYWGIYFIEERGDERYLESHYGADPDNVNIIAAWGGLENGSSDSYYALYYWLAAADLSDPEQYQYFSSQIDIPNFIDYMIFELFSGNVDWPINNVRCWQEGNAPWRWFFYDGDCCFYDQKFDVYANITYDGVDIVYPTAGWSTLFFRKLLESETFVKDYLARLREVSQNCLAYRNTKPLLDNILQQVQGEIQHQVERFNNPGSVGEWKTCCHDVDKYLCDRQDEFEMQTKNFFGLADKDVDFVCYPNPSINGQVNIKFVTNDLVFDDLVIYDINGRCVFRDSFLSGGGASVPISHQFSSGVYVLKIGPHSKKIVVM
jgi:hypothetical protein